MSKLIELSDENFSDIISVLSLYKSFYAVARNILPPEDLESYAEIESRIDQILEDISNSGLSTVNKILQLGFNEGYRRGELKGVEDIICLRGFKQKENKREKRDIYINGVFFK